jgi:hypothetical protein
MAKKRGLSSVDARNIRQKGHNDALEFALLIGSQHDYRNDSIAKKDVIDLAGDAHSVKSGVKKWQLFLYSISRFREDDFFQTMNGIGQLLVQCIESFPENFDDYVKDKHSAKERCRIHMRGLAELMREKRRLRAFINKSMFNGGEVNYLTVKHDGNFHVFLNKDVVQVFADNVEVGNSKARSANQVSEQKVIFKYDGKNLAELEMRNDSPLHYREIRFNMIKPKMMKLLFSKIAQTGIYNDRVFIYGEASKKFGK